MSKGAKENWFESPHIKNGIWQNYEEKSDLFSFSKHSSQQRFTFLTPSRNSKPIEMQKGLKPYYGYNNEAENNRFEDINLPNMYSNTIIGGQVINEKINFQDSSVISEQNDCFTPSRQDDSYREACERSSKELPKTAAKDRPDCFHQEKKTRPKQKGLRMLSQKAFEIVNKMNGATYKQVANKLVEELALEDTLEINGKDEQNIKRRVYDALNVLIALGILKKDGRKIYGLKNQSESQIAYRQQLEKVAFQTKCQQFKVHDKIKQFRNAKNRFQMIRALIKRNSQSLHKNNKIEFPFIAICVKQEDEKKVVIKDNTIQIQCSQKKIQPFGDMDTIQFLSHSLKLFAQ